jgi:hypothetical protein
MIPTTLLAPAVLALVLGCQFAWAQPEQNDTPAAAPAPGEQASGSDNGAATSGGGTAPTKPARAGGSPSDYRASEEISEDLPVSFPVDI